jgi:hypothetical protein
MEAKDIIRQIALERGLNAIDEKNIDLVPLKDLNIHKQEIWSLSITSDPDAYFTRMDEKYKNKTGYYCKFQLKNINEGLRLCRELSQDFGTQPCELSSTTLDNNGKPLYLVIHIHPEFKFTPKPDPHNIDAATRELVLNFI